MPISSDDSRDELTKSCSSLDPSTDTAATFFEGSRPGVRILADRVHRFPFPFHFLDDKRVSIPRDSLSTEGNCEGPPVAGSASTPVFQDNKTSEVLRFNGHFGEIDDFGEIPRRRFSVRVGL